MRDQKISGDLTTYERCPVGVPQVISVIVPVIRKIRLAVAVRLSDVAGTAPAVISTNNTAAQPDITAAVIFSTVRCNTLIVLRYYWCLYGSSVII